MRENPFDPKKLEKGQHPNSFTMGDPMHAPFAFNSQRNERLQERSDPEYDVIAMDRQTIECLQDLLDTMADTFEEHDMFELAEQAKSVSAML